MWIAVYQVWMLVLDALALRLVRARPRPVRFFSVVLLGGLLAIFGAFPIARLHESGSMFVVLGLWASAIFVHGPLVMFGGWLILRREHPRWSWLPLFCGSALAAIAVEAFAVEPTMLEVNRHEIVTDRITAPVKIVVLADFQTDHLGGYEELVLATVAAEEPDLLLLPGDYIHVLGQARYEQLCSGLNVLLRELELTPKYGIHAVRGNTERNSWPDVFRGMDAELYLKRRTTTQGELSITGLTLGESSWADLAVAEQPGFHIVLGHVPNFALGDVDADLLIAGHTHGGQVQLPGIGPLITLSQVPRDWAAGRTELEGGRSLIVSRGTGMERVAAPRLRFFCRPELVVINLVPAVPVARSGGEAAK